jgi:DNA-directed RNA polymerase subunit M/transcription elongation factor TFIIS
MSDFASCFAGVLPDEHENFIERLTQCLSVDQIERAAQIQRLRFYLRINQSLLQRLPEELVNLSTSELAAGSEVESRVNKQSDAQKEYENLILADFLAPILGSGKKAIRCSKCGSEKVVVVTSQKRAADEGFTAKASCPCGKRWTM